MSVYRLRNKLKTIQKNHLTSEAVTLWLFLLRLALICEREWKAITGSFSCAKYRLLIYGLFYRIAEGLFFMLYVYLMNIAWIFFFLWHFISLYCDLLPLQMQFLIILWQDHLQCIDSNEIYEESYEKSFNPFSTELWIDENLIF